MHAQFKETEQAPEAESVMAGMLELSEQEFEATMSTMPRALMGEIDKIQEQMANTNRKMKIPRKNQKETPEIKNITNRGETS